MPNDDGEMRSWKSRLVTPVKVWNSIALDGCILLHLIMLCNNNRELLHITMKATAQISSNNGHTVLPAAVRRFLGIGKGARIEFESRSNGEVVVRPLPTLDALF